MFIRSNFVTNSSGTCFVVFGEILQVKTEQQEELISQYLQDKETAKKLLAGTKCGFNYISIGIDGGDYELYIYRNGSISYLDYGFSDIDAAKINQATEEKWAADVEEAVLKLGFNSNNPGWKVYFDPSMG